MPRVTTANPKQRNNKRQQPETDARCRRRQSPERGPDARTSRRDDWPATALSLHSGQQTMAHLLQANNVQLKRFEQLDQAVDVVDPALVRKVVHVVRANAQRRCHRSERVLAEKPAHRSTSSHKRQALSLNSLHPFGCSQLANQAHRTTNQQRNNKSMAKVGWLTKEGMDGAMLCVTTVSGVRSFNSAVAAAPWEFACFCLAFIAEKAHSLLLKRQQKPRCHLRSCTRAACNVQRCFWLSGFFLFICFLRTLLGASDFVSFCAAQHLPNCMR